MNFEDFGIYGYDVSFYQDINLTPKKIDFQKMKDSGASFVIIRAGQDTYTDEDFRDNWRNAKGILPRSAYWFGDKDSTGKSQAGRFWNLVKDDQPEGMLFIDYEGGSWTDWNQLYDFIAELQRLSGYPDTKIGIYTAYYYWMDNSPSNPESRNWFKQYPLWLAWYASTPAVVKIPTPWTEVLIWQDGVKTNGLEVGVESREIDHDKFNGDAEKFELYMGGTVIVPPSGGNMEALYYADLISGKTSNVRTGPSTAYPIKEQILGPQTVTIVSEKTVAEGYDWYQIALPVSGFIALTTSYTNFKPAGTTPVNTIEVTLKYPDGTIYKGTVTKQ
jgi:GH25 family lysozyme M1 (1,4-beta-N-acetylmuramidase)